MKKIKTRGESVPTEKPGESTTFIVTISVEPKTGAFHATIPVWLYDLAETVWRSHEGIGDRKVRDLCYNGNTHTVYAADMAGVMDEWKRLISRIKEVINDNNRKKVIVVLTEMNIYVFRDGKMALNRNDISFAKTKPLIGFSYRVVYRLGEALVDEKGKWVGNIDKYSAIIPYSPEYEEFFADLTLSFENAALKLNSLVAEIADDPTKILSMTTKMLER